MIILLRHRVELLSSALVAVLFSWQLLVRPGVPDFVQDWAWPTTTPDLRGLWNVSWSSWSQESLGHSSLLNFALPIWALFGAAGFAFHTQFVVRCAVAGAFAILFLSVIAVVRSLGGGKIASAGAALLIAGSPFTLYELAAGHLIFLYALAAALFAFAWTVDGRRDILRVCLLCSAGAVALCQQQFVILLPVFLACATLLGGRRSWYNAAICYGAGLAAHVVSLAYVLHPSTVSFLLQRHYPIAQWESSQSAAPLDVLSLQAMPVHYIAAAPHMLQTTSFWSVLFLLVICAVRARWDKRTIATLALFALSLLIECQQFFHTGGAFQAAVRAFSPLAVLRELVNFQALVALAFCLALSNVRLPSRVILAIAAIAALPLAAQTLWKVVPLYRPSAQTLAAVEKIRGEGGMERYLALPTGNPVRIRGQNAGGMDALYGPLGTHGSIYAVEPDQPSARAMNMALFASPSDSLLRSLGVAWVFTRPELESNPKDFVQPNYAKWVAQAHPVLYSRHLANVTKEWVSTSLISVRGDFDEVDKIEGAHWCFSDQCPPRAFVTRQRPSRGTQSAFIPLPGSFSPSDASNDPQTAWVSMYHWYFAAPLFATPKSLGVWTASHEKLAISNAAQADVWARMAAPAGAVIRCEGMCKTGTQFVRPGGFRWYSLGKASSIYADGRPILVSEIDELQTALAPASAAAPQSVSFSIVSARPWSMRFEIAPHGKRLYLSNGERYDTGWRAVADGVDLGAAQFVANGYANGWVLPAGARSVYVFFRPQMSFAIEQAGALVLILAPLLYGAIWRPLTSFWTQHGSRTSAKANASK